MEILSLFGGISLLRAALSMVNRFSPLMYDRQTIIKVQQREKNWVLVAGASDGIGKAFAFKLASMDYNLILLGRNSEKLEKVTQEILAQHKNNSIITEIRDFDSDQSELVIDQQISLIINCIGQTEMHRGEDTKKLKTLLHTNIYSQTLLTSLLLRQNQKNSHMIQVGSLLGRQSFPFVSLYSGTKAFNKAFFDSINYEISGQLMNITPYYVSTKMTGYKKDFWSISPEEFVSSAIKQFNYGKKNAVGHYKHELIDILFHIDYIKNRQILQYKTLFGRMEAVKQRRLKKK